MRRIIIALAAFGLTMAFTGVAVAKGPKRPPQPTVVEVTMTGAISGSITMAYSASGNRSLIASDWANECFDLILAIEGFEDGAYCAFNSGNAVPDAYPGTFRLIEQGDGTVEMVIDFDRLWEETVHPKSGKTGARVVHIYKLTGFLSPGEGGFDWGAGGTLSGQVELTRFTREPENSWVYVGTAGVNLVLDW